jgi:hypothetical protein
MLGIQVTKWVVQGLAAHLKQQPESFIKAAEDMADGVTIQVTISNPPGFPQLREVLKGKSVSIANLKSSDSPPAKIEISAGYNRE